MAENSRNKDDDFKMYLLACSDGQLEAVMLYLRKYPGFVKERDANTGETGLLNALNSLPNRIERHTNLLGIINYHLKGKVPVSQDIIRQTYDASRKNNNFEAISILKPYIRKEKIKG